MSKAAPQFSREQETKATEIHAKAIVVDMCEVSGLRGFDRDYVTRLKEGGVTCSGVCIPNGMAGLSEAISQVAGWYKRVGELGPSIVRLTTTVREIREAKDGGWIAAVLNPQGSTFLGYDLTNLEIFAKLGVRVAQPSYASRNQFSDGNQEDTPNVGLSQLGFQWVEEMNRLHLLISLSHIGVKSSLDAIEHSKDPVVFTHSNAYGIVSDQGSRNVNDEQIKSCTEKGGMIGITTSSTFLSSKPTREVNVNDFIDHIDYIIRLSGVDHVGIGTDVGWKSYITTDELENYRTRIDDIYELKTERARNHHDELIKSGREKIPFYEVWNPWFKGAPEILTITKGLVARGYSEQEIIKILGGNFLRIFERVWGS